MVYIGVITHLLTSWDIQLRVSFCKYLPPPPRKPAAKTKLRIGLQFFPEHGLYLSSSWHIGPGLLRGSPQLVSG